MLYRLGGTNVGVYGTVLSFICSKDMVYVLRCIQNYIQTEYDLFRCIFVPFKKCKFGCEKATRKEFC